MKILLLDPYLSDSHATWKNAIKQFSQFKVQAHSLSPMFWKWRMHIGAVTMAEYFTNQAQIPDLFLVTSMLDLASFKGLISTPCHIPSILYFHENQLTHPLSPNETGRDYHYTHIHFTSCLAADKIVFNTQYHCNEFFNALENFLRRMKDHRHIDKIQSLINKTSILPLGFDKKWLQADKKEYSNRPIQIVWNHRWEQDKNPDDVLTLCRKLKNNNVVFDLHLLGDNKTKIPESFESLKLEFPEQLKSFGKIKEKSAYYEKLLQSDIVLSTANHDFFGLGILEAAACGCELVLPNRLSYPELYPQCGHFYNDISQASDIITQLSQNKLQKKLPRQEISKYEWTKVINKYDNLFQETYETSKIKIHMVRNSAEYNIDSDFRIH